jgi:hypothetical protein
MNAHSAMVALLAPLIVSATPSPTQTCAPAPIVTPGPNFPPNSTYISHGEPPKRYGYPPTYVVRVAFGRANIDAICGRPPCGNVFLGCNRGGVMVLPDPFATDSEEFARIARHELGHVNGWPASHGD